MGSAAADVRLGSSSGGRARARGAVAAVAGRLAAARGGAAPRSADWLTLTPKDALPQPDHMAASCTSACCPAPSWRLAASQPCCRSRLRPSHSSAARFSFAILFPLELPLPTKVLFTGNVSGAVTVGVGAGDLAPPPAKRPNKHPAPMQRPSREQYAAMCARAQATGQPLPAHVFAHIIIHIVVICMYIEKEVIGNHNEIDQISMPLLREVVTFDIVSTIEDRVAIYIVLREQRMCERRPRAGRHGVVHPVGGRGGRGGRGRRHAVQVRRRVGVRVHVGRPLVARHRHRHRQRQRRRRRAVRRRGPRVRRAGRHVGALRRRGRVARAAAVPVAVAVGAGAEVGRARAARRLRLQRRRVRVRRALGVGRAPRGALVPHAQQRVDAVAAHVLGDGRVAPARGAVLRAGGLGSLRRVARPGRRRVRRRAQRRHGLGSPLGHLVLEADAFHLPQDSFAGRHHHVLLSTVRQFRIH
ncbi:unnamed protein product [Leptidea sinapis]|uniref:Uncharacterized protein n=1 Tax=Leptidea sinapis TaxID=189913 RepID=A0A5E4QUW3_9NEOP|nr:unnamed protein product [Leptidea sinapis]